MIAIAASQLNMSDKRPESPTTVKPLDLSDDEDIQESGIINMDNVATKDNTSAALASTTEAPHASEVATSNSAKPMTVLSDEVPPPKPPRPISEQQKNEAILKEAFPTIGASVIKAVLIASGGRIDPAFNALLAMSDPDAVQQDHEDEQPPQQPPRPTGNAQSQLEADEAYARRLAEHYESAAYEDRMSNRSAYPQQRSRRQQTGLKPNELHDGREHSFLDDDLPAIQEQLKRGFQETQVKVNSWFKDLKKKFDEQFDEGEGESVSFSQQRGRYGGAGIGGQRRKSRDYERYDADPELLSDDFAGMKLHNDDLPTRQGSQNSNIFRSPPTSVSPKPSDGRKVVFKECAEETDIYSASPRNAPKDSPSTGGKTSKWQPLSDVEPSPIAENDPFSLGDSDDDKDAKDKPGKSGVKIDNSEERLRKAAAEAMADSLVEDKAEKDETKK